ncbi:DUF222 domain-containing protein [Microtetraspora malaysiensis]|uniref:HNH endonuclease signature motif containing protein n=1 Tax=Microtetraspora malaysiensis TaxID=161358 RepID=UPI003D8F156D
MFTIDDFLPDAAKGGYSTANSATSTKSVPPFVGRLGRDAAAVETPTGADPPVGESVSVVEAHSSTVSDGDGEHPRAVSASDTDATPFAVDADPSSADVDSSFAEFAFMAGPGGGRGSGVSWPLVAQVRQVASALAVGVVPDAPGVCLAEAEDLLFARDRLISAIAARVERVHVAGEARRGGHASTRSWLRGAAGMSVAGAGRVLALATELARLPTVRARFAEGSLAEGLVTAICSATARLTDEQAGLAEPILVGLADQATPAEIARAGRYLRAVLDPDGEADDSETDYRERFLLVRESASGGLEGEFRLPREAGARLRTLLEAYAKPRAEGDERPLRVRNADVLIALLEQQIGTELLVLINAESLPDDPPASPPGGTSTSTPAGTPAPTRSEASDPARSEATGPSRNRASDSNPAGTSPFAGGEASAASSADASGSPEGRASGWAVGDNEGAAAEHQRACDTGLGATDTRPGTQNAEPGTQNARASTHDGARHKPEPPQTQQAKDDERRDQAVRDGVRRDRPAQDNERLGQSDQDETSREQGARSDGRPGQSAGHDAGRGQRAGGRDTRAGGPNDRPARDGGQRKQGQGQEQGRAQAQGTARGQVRGQGQARGRGADWATPGGLISGRTLPGLLLATGQFLPTTDIHRLAQTSGLTRLVMDADGCVLDVGRTARRATRRQRRTILARYTRCMVDHCPMPAHLCQIDHITNWSDGGTTDLDNLGPTCQFHNRDRYRNPDNYQLHRVGKNRWGFTYIGPRSSTRAGRVR